MSKLFRKALSNVSGEIRRFVGHSFDISNEIFDILEAKGVSQRELANRLGKKESEVSRWMSGTHNLTLKTISKIEDALGEEIIMTPSQARIRYQLIGKVQPVEFGKVISGVFKVCKPLPSKEELPLNGKEPIAA